MGMNRLPVMSTKGGLLLQIAIGTLDRLAIDRNGRASQGFPHGRAPPWFAGTSALEPVYIRTGRNDYSEGHAGTPPAKSLMSRSPSLAVE